MSESFYSRIERGDRVLSVDTLVKISRFYDMSLDYLLLESAHGDNEERLQIEIASIFRDKSPSQSALLLNLLKIQSESIDRLQPGS